MTSTFYREKKHRRLGLQLRLLSIAVFFLILFFVHKPIFRWIGAFLNMPQSQQTCDIILVQGGYLVPRFFFNHACEQFRQGYGEHILIVYSESNDIGGYVGVDDPRKLIHTALNEYGLDSSDVTLLPIIPCPPFTLNMAKRVKQYCLQNDVKSVMILNDNFHIRRSFLTFNKICKSDSILIRPHSVKIYLDKSNWWQHSNGVRRVFGEYVQLGYYLIKGYI